VIIPPLLEGLRALIRELFVEMPNVRRQNKIALARSRIELLERHNLADLDDAVIRAIAADALGRRGRRALLREPPGSAHAVCSRLASQRSTA
jgi:hypothetical protein